MTWLQPWAVWFLSGVPIVVALYFLRLKRRRITVPTLMFWQRVTQQNTRRSLFQKLRNLLSLLLHVLIFLLLAGALARPVLDRFIREGASTVLVLDARARMQAIEPDGRTRFEKALRLARDYARQAGSRHQFALLTLAAKPAVIVPFTDDERSLFDALDHAIPTDATGELTDALNLAQSVLAARSGDRRIVLLTDRPATGEATAATTVTTHPVGTSLDNLAITRFATRPLPSSPETAEVLLEVRNFGRSAAHTEIEIALDGRPVEVKPLALAPGGRQTEIFTLVPRSARNSRRWLTAKLSTQDALPPDNIAYAMLPPARRDRVLLVSKGNAFLEKVLSADPGVKFQLVAADAYQPSMAGKFEAVIFDDTLPEAFDLRTVTGNFLFLKATPFRGKGAPLAQPLVTDIDASHPATRLVSLQSVTILRAESLDVPPPRDGWTFSAPLRSLGHPLLIAGERGTQRIAALAFDVLESDLPLRVAFPLLMNSTLRWLAGDRSGTMPAVSAGETVPLAPGQSIAEIPLTSLGDKAPAPSATVLFEPSRNGFYEVNDNGNRRWLAVNTFNEAESDLRISAAEQAPALIIPPSRLALPGWPPWLWLTLGAFVLISVEWWLFHRRKTE